VKIYHVKFKLKENMFFSSREFGDFYITENVVGNYALAYAFGLVKSPYRIEVDVGKPAYREDFATLNKAGIYVFPGTPVVVFSKIETFNSMTDSYWYKMSNNVVTDDLFYRDAPVNKKPRPVNMPQKGRIKYVGIDSSFCTYIISREPLSIPRYIRLGKWMSKAVVYNVVEFTAEPQKGTDCFENYMNPADFEHVLKFKAYDLLNVPPVPLLRNVQYEGEFLHCFGGGQEFKLPCGGLMGGLEC
jgi:CRISPR-associated protein Csc1